MATAQKLRFDQVIEAAKRLNAERIIRDCVLCKNRAVGVGIFIPFAETQEKLGVAGNKACCVFYGLCARHRKNSAAIDRIEDEILRRGFVAIN